MAQTMKALVFHGAYDVRLEDRPSSTPHPQTCQELTLLLSTVPKIKEPSDVIIKTTSAALCGSELHAYRGHVPAPPGYITGHEGAGLVKEVGSAVKKFKVGDYIVTPFTSACMECFYCKAGCSGRCEKCQLLGSPILDGTQAEYFRVPLADSTLFKAPAELGEELVLMSDIYPTGSVYLSGFEDVLHLRNCQIQWSQERFHRLSERDVARNDGRGHRVRASRFVCYRFCP